MVAFSRVVVLPIRVFPARLLETDFIPCEWGDPRGTLLMRVDQTGRTVVAVTNFEERLLGWQWAPTRNPDMDVWKSWLSAHWKITKEERSHNERRR